MRLPTKVGVVMMVSVNDVSPGSMVKTVYSLTEAAISKVHSTKSKTAENSETASTNNKVQLLDYEGSYYVPNYEDDSYIGVNENGLFSISIFDNDVSANIQTWLHDKDDTFRKQRTDGTLAEPITFERDATGNVVSVVQHGYRSLKRQ